MDILQASSCTASVLGNKRSCWLIQVSNYFAPTDKAKQEGVNAYLTDKNAERLATALCRMRGAALKLGQMLSIQDEGVLPPQVTPVAYRLLVLWIKCSSQTQCFAMWALAVDVHKQVAMQFAVDA